VPFGSLTLGRTRHPAWCPACLVNVSGLFFACLTLNNTTAIWAR